MSEKITDITGIGAKTEQKLRKRLRKNRPTSRIGETVSITDVERNQAIAKSILAADQQRAIKEAGGRIKLDRDARKQEAAASQEKRRQERQESDTIRRGDFRVSKDGIREAQDRFEELPSEERSDDKNSREPVTTDLDLWTENINTLDYPGVDTPSSRRVRAEPSDSVLNSPTSQQRPRENWRDSQPERTATQERLGEQPDKADAERTGIYRAGDGEFVKRPLQPADDGQFVSQNGQVVSSLQDPTIGRDPDDGEFEDMPLGQEPTVPFPETDAGTKTFDRTVTVGITPSTLGDGFTIETDDDIADRTLGSGTEVVEQADQNVGLPSANEADSTDVVAEAEIGFQDRDSGFGYNTEVVETRETDDSIFNFR